MIKWSAIWPEPNTASGLTRMNNVCTCISSRPQRLRSIWTASRIKTSGRSQFLSMLTVFIPYFQYSFRIFSQSDFPDFTMSSWIADFPCWSQPEVLILVHSKWITGFLLKNSRWTYFKQVCPASNKEWLITSLYLQSGKVYSTISIGQPFSRQLLAVSRKVVPRRKA